MINISKLTTNLSDIVTALNGKWEFRSETDKSGNKICWVILGKIIFCDDLVSKNAYDEKCGYKKEPKCKYLNWHECDGGYWAVLREIEYKE